ncbi:MAG: hypothetical protein KKB50_20165 [Planctomycetes bacterium]|nr:hypothetical protein [Planctomycetota bacterium]
MRSGTIVVGLLAAVLLAAPGFGQDSVSTTSGLPGDAVSPWADATTMPFGSEQCNYYVVDLTPFQTSKGTIFGIAPIIKSSKASSGFFGSLLSAQGMSRRQLVGVPFHSTKYYHWADAGYGVNNDPAINIPGTTIEPTDASNQFGVLFSEFATTDELASYNGVIGGIVNYTREDPGRLYVSRIMAANNSCDNASNLSQFGVGSVDEDGFVHFRADGYGCTGGCGLNVLQGNNIFRVDMARRNCDVLNVVSNDWPGGMFDATPEWLVRNAADTYNPPGIVSTAIMGGPFYIGTNTISQYARGATFPAVVADSTHLAPGVIDHRGNIAYTSRNCAFLNSTHGLCGILGKADEQGPTDIINVWGLDNNGNVTGAVALQLPAVVTDNWDGVNNLAGVNEFDHYHSQVAYRGGNGQVALGVDQAGNLLVAAQVDHPNYGGSDWPVNYIAVARLECTSGAVAWTMAGYNQGVAGKAIVDGSAAPIAQMVSLDNVTGGTPFGPSVSAPMIDSVGNVWFLSAIEYDPQGPNQRYTSGLLRGTYDPANFAFELELVFKNWDVFAGQNSNRDYAISFLSIADSNSVDSGTAWSQNISEMQFLGGYPADLEPGAPEALGGLVIGAEITYDWDQNGEFEPDNGAGQPDQEYNVLLYISAMAPACEYDCGDCNCDGAVNGFDIDYFIDALNMTPGQWDNAYPDCDLICAADTNGDQAVNGFDIDGFIQVLNTGTCPRDE